MKDESSSMHHLLPEMSQMEHVRVHTRANYCKYNYVKTDVHGVPIWVL